MSTPITSPITPDHTLNEVVARVPQALSVLHGWGLDTCCGGALTLRVAVRHGLELDGLLAELRRAQPQPQL